MECEACTDRLVDLLDEELGDADAAATRAHLAGCERCAAAFERVSAGHELASLLTLEAPPAGLLDGVMAAARDRAAVRASANPEPVPIVRADPRGPREPIPTDEGSPLMRWLGSFAMRPQAAMAMSLLLMVGIGLWYLPDWRGMDPTNAQTILDPAAGEEVGPSAGLIPAEPLALEEDARHARIRQRAETEEKSPSRRGQQAVAQERARRVAANDRATAENAGDDRPAATTETEPQTQARAETATLAAEGQTQAVDDLRQAAGAAPAPSAGPGELEEAPADESALGEVLAGELLAAEASADAPAPRAYGGASAGAGTSGTAPAPPRPQARQAESPAQSGDLLPPALHRMARNQAAANRCAQAVSSYRSLLSRYPSYPRASEARVELAECYRRLGQLTRARSVLEAAARDPRTANRAQRELVRLEAAERAMDRAETDRTPDRPARRAPAAAEAPPP